MPALSAQTSLHGDKVDDDRDSSGWSASAYNVGASFVYSAAATAPVLSLLDARPGEKILDFGCGSGEITKELKKLVGDEGVVVGVDISESMVSFTRSTSYSEYNFANNIHFFDRLRKHSK